MNIKKCSNPKNISGIEEWMTQFFTDPFTSLLDEQTFRVDLFETNDDYIVEAELNEQIQTEDIKIQVSHEHIIITINTKNKLKEKESNEIIRKVTLPYSVEQKEIIATFTNGILEIKISKTLESDRFSPCIKLG